MVDVRRQVLLELVTSSKKALADFNAIVKATTAQVKIDREVLKLRKEQIQVDTAQARLDAQKANVDRQTLRIAEQELKVLREEQNLSKAGLQADREAIRNEEAASRAKREKLAALREEIALERDLAGEEQEGNERRKRTRISLQDIAATIFIVRNAWTALGTAIQTVQGFVTGFIASNEELERGLVGTAASIASSNEIISETGEAIDNPTEAIQRLLPALRNAREEVVQLAADIPGITETDIQPVFENLAGQIGQLGLEIEELPRLAASTAAAFQTFNVSLFQARQEIQSLIRGEVNRNTEIANRLGLQAEDLRQARDRGELGAFLTEQFAAAAEGAFLLADQTDNAFSNIQTTIARTFREIREPLVEPIQELAQAVSSFIANLEGPLVQAGQQFAEQLVVGFRVVQQFAARTLPRLQPAIRAITGTVQDIVANIRNLIDGPVGRLLIDFIDRLIDFTIRAANVLLPTIRTISGVVRTILVAGLEAAAFAVERIVDGLSLGTDEIRAQRRLLDRQLAATERLREIFRDNLKISEDEVALLERELQATVGIGQAEIFITRLKEQQLMLAEEEEAIQNEIISNEATRRDLIEDEAIELQTSLNTLSATSRAQQEILAASKETSEEFGRQSEFAQNQLRVTEALAQLEAQRSQRNIGLLEAEREQLQAEREATESRAERRRLDRELERNAERIEEERRQQLINERNLQEAQAAAQAAQIESQRVLNQLKVDQLEIENEIALLQQQQALRSAEGQRAELEREGGTESQFLELDNQIADLQAQLERTAERGGNIGAQRAAIDAAAASSQQALAIQQQAQTEAFLDEFGQFLVQSGDREAERIAASDRLNPIEVADRLQELAQERLGIGGQALSPSSPLPVAISPVQSAIPSGPDAASPATGVSVNFQPLLAPLASILQAIPTAQDLAILSRQSAISQPTPILPRAQGGLETQDTSALESVGS